MHLVEVKFVSFWSDIRQGELEALILNSPKTIIWLDQMPSQADSRWDEVS